MCNDEFEKRTSLCSKKSVYYDVANIRIYLHQRICCFPFSVFHFLVSMFWCPSTMIKPPQYCPPCNFSPGENAITVSPISILLRFFPSTYVFSRLLRGENLCVRTLSARGFFKSFSTFFRFAVFSEFTLRCLKDSGLSPCNDFFPCD